MAQETAMNSLDVTSLESLCKECEGKGCFEDKDTGSRYPCGFCDGTGYVLTDFGEQVFMFLDRTKQRMRFRSRTDSPPGC